MSRIRWSAATRNAIALTLLIAALLSCASAPEYDLLLHGGTVVDGTGAERFEADVAIRGDRIAAVQKQIPHRAARRVLDISGLVLAPGFWDNHAHLVDLEDHPLAENFLRQGITTILAPLHSQDQVFPLEPYIERVRMAPNVGLFAGHTWIRKQVLGLEDRAPTAEELLRMSEMVEQSMSEGALGLSTGLEYVPATFAKTDELVALAKIAARHGGIYATHLRDEGPAVLDAIREALTIGVEAQIPVQINHHKVTGADQFGWSRQTLELLDAATAAGQQVAHDVYPYTAYSTYSDLMFPPWALAGGASAFLQRTDDTQMRARLVEEMLVRFGQQAGAGPASIQFRDVPDRPELRGQTLEDYLLAERQSATVESAVEALIELQREGRFIGIFHGMYEDDVIRILRHPSSMIETDGDLVTIGEGHPHPRSYGSFPRVLSRYVRELGVLTLEQAVAKMTSMPASWIGHEDRGVIRSGAFADLVIFDAERIADLATYTDPHQHSVGVEHLLINGVLVIEETKLTLALPGRFLERHASRPPS